MSHVKTHPGLPVEIIEYLGSHPDVFVHHPELLSGFNIPHATGKNVSSLIESQVIHLRQELDELRNTISRMEFDSRYHKKLVADIHALALELIAA